MQRKPKLFFGVDNDYVWPLLVSVFSAKKSFSALNKVYILYDPNFLDLKMITFIEKQTRLIGVCRGFKPDGIISI